MPTIILFLRLFTVSHPAPDSATVTYLDMSGPADAESEFPTVTKKGAL